MKSLTIALCALIINFTNAYQGYMTYYYPGLGSCGETNSNSDAIVALSTTIMKNPANPNNNPLCGTQINIYNPATGTTTQAKIVDTCEGCGEYDIDVSPSVFQNVDPNGLGDGRIVVDWGGSTVGGKKRDLNGKMRRFMRSKNVE